MNYTGRLLKSFLFCASIALSGCGGESEIRLHGHMETLQFEGQTCWIFVDDMHKKYEVVTPSPEVLKEGLQMTVKAVSVERQTLCMLPTVIDIIEYRPDFAKDM